MAVLFFNWVVQKNLRMVVVVRGQVWTWQGTRCRQRAACWR